MAITGYYRTSEEKGQAHNLKSRSLITKAWPSSWTEGYLVHALHKTNQGAGARLVINPSREAKFNPKVGSRRTIKI